MLDWHLSEVVKFIEKKETAKVLVKEISSSNKNHVLFVNENHTIKKGKKDSNRFVREIRIDTIDNDVDINITAEDDENLRRIKVTRNISAAGDTTIEETILWQAGSFDSLIHKKTKIIENVFESCLGEKSNIKIERLNRDEKLILF